MKKLEEAEKAKDQAEQDGYKVGVAETEETFRSEVTGVCRVYYLQVWNEALNQVGVEASSAFRRAENVYYPPAIRTSGPSSSQDDTTPNATSPTEEALSKDPPSPSNPQKGEEQAKEQEALKEAPLEMAKSSDVPKDTFKDGMAFQGYELVLVTLPIPTKEDPKGKEVVSFTAATTQPAKTPKDKLVLKMKR